MNNNLHRFIIKHLVILILIFKYFLPNIHFSEFINMYKRFPLRIHLIFRSLTKSFTEQRKEEREEVHRVCRVSP